MDPLSHLAFGRTLIALAPAGRRWRGTIGAAVLGSVAPDLDAIVMPFGWDRYLRLHEIGTHSLVGTLVGACLTALAVRAFRRETPLAPLLAAAWLGSLSHVLLDVVSGAQIRVGWPLLDRHWTLPLVAMADPILLVLLVGGVLLLAITDRQRHRHAAVAALVTVALFLSIKGALAWRAFSAYQSALGTSPATEARVVEADWGSLRRWTIFDRTEDELRVWRTVAGHPGAELALRWPRPEATALVAKSRSLSTVRNLLRTHDLPLATVVTMADGHATVLWSDIRYCWDGAVTGVPADQPIASLADGRRLACGLWFGGEFDGEGGLVRQIVRIGSITQTRQ